MALFRVANNRAQFDAAGLETSDQYGAGIRFTQGGNARVTTSAGTFYNQGIPMSGTGQVAIVDATAGLPSGTVFHNGLPMSGDKVCVSKNATAIVANGLPFDSAGALAADINLDLNFIGTDTLNSSVTFTRASTATFFNSSGVLTSAAINTPRFDYNPTTLAARGLLIEEQRQNLLPRSEEFSNASWTKGGATVTADSTTAPSGTATADTLTEDTSTGQHRVYRTVSGTTNTNPYTVTFFAKAGTRNRVYVGINESPTFGRNGNAVFDLSAGTVLFANTGSGGATGGSATIQNVGNGWYRCAYTLTLGGIDTSIFVDFNLVNTGTNITYTGNGTGSLFIWGAQLEAGAFPTSYIPTTTTALTRNADVASVNTLSPWYNASEGTIYAEATARLGITQGFAVFEGTAGAGMRVRKNSANQYSGVLREPTNRDINLTPSPALTEGQIIRQALAIKANDCALSGGGQSPGTQTTFTIPTVTAFAIGGSAGAGEPFANSWIRRITYYPRRLSNAELQAITA